MKRKITFAGNIITDNVKMIPSLPDKGMLVPITSMRFAAGGSVCNTGIDLKTLDPEIAVSALGMIGADAAGDFALEKMVKAGLDTHLVARAKDVPTSFTDCMTITGTGERTFFNFHGADSRLTPGDVDPAQLDCDIFHLGYLLLLDGLDAADAEYGTAAARLLAKVQAAGIRTSLDIVSEQSERFARIVRPALRYCDYAIINEVEARLATGEQDLRKAAAALFALGVRERVVIHCPEGSLTMDKAGTTVILGSLILPKDWIVGSTGAGDAFCAGMLYSLLTDRDPETGMRIASCAAAQNLTVADATSGARNLAETLALDARFERRALDW